MDFTGKVALVTGGGGDIGRACVLGFASRGAKVVVVDLDEAAGRACAELALQRGGEARFVRADVTRAAQVRGYVEASLDAYGAIDCFFNNAGIEGSIAPTQEYDEAMFDAVIAVNLKGVFLGLRHVLPVMLRQGAGAIVNSASITAVFGGPGMPAYVASKHGVLGLTKAAALEYNGQGIRVNAVCPGMVDTPMIQSWFDMSPDMAKAVLATMPGGKLGRPDQVAEAAVWLCSDAASWVSGLSMNIDGGTINR
jgi:NAD(P)-dependent dehydrogenase (short-subunit alcohol dehydrogenase family)